MLAEPKECLEDIAMAQWEEASVITVRGTVKSEGSLCVKCTALLGQHLARTVFVLVVVR